MNEGRELLRLRHDVLVARSAMLRLRAARDLEALRESLTLPSLAGSVASSTRARSMLFGTLLVMLGGKGFSRVLRFAAAILAGAKLARFVGRHLRERSASASAETGEIGS